MANYFGKWLAIEQLCSEYGQWPVVIFVSTPECQDTVPKALMVMDGGGTALNHSGTKLSLWELHALSL